jgi:hypothetical protein
VARSILSRRSSSADVSTDAGLLRYHALRRCGLDLAERRGDLLALSARRRRRHRAARSAISPARIDDAPSTAGSVTGCAGAAGLAASDSTFATPRAERVDIGLVCRVGQHPARPASDSGVSSQPGGLGGTPIEPAPRLMAPVRAARQDQRRTARRRRSSGFGGRAGMRGRAPHARLDSVIRGGRRRVIGRRRAVGHIRGRQLDGRRRAALRLSPVNEAPGLSCLFVVHGNPLLANRNTSRFLPPRPLQLK